MLISFRFLKLPNAAGSMTDHLIDSIFQGDSSGLAQILKTMSIRPVTKTVTKVGDHIEVYFKKSPLNIFEGFTLGISADATPSNIFNKLLSQSKPAISVSQPDDDYRVFTSKFRQNSSRGLLAIATHSKAQLKLDEALDPSRRLRSQKTGISMSTLATFLLPKTMPKIDKKSIITEFCQEEEDDAQSAFERQTRFHSLLDTRLQFSS
jgi:hypothetical protein